MKRIGLIFSLVILQITQLPAQEMAVPVNLQLSLFLKILTYERNLKKHVGDEIVMGIVYQNKFRKSRQTKNELMDVIDKSPSQQVDGIPIRFVPVDIDATDITNAISKHSLELLYFAPLRAVKIRSILEACSEKKVISLTGVPDYVKSGVAVGIGLRDASPKILINLKSAKQEGADFDSQLLNLSKVYK